MLPTAYSLVLQILKINVFLKTFQNILVEKHLYLPVWITGVNLFTKNKVKNLKYIFHRVSRMADTNMLISPKQVWLYLSENVT